MPTYYGFPTFDERSTDCTVKGGIARCDLERTAERFNERVRELLTDFWLHSHNINVSIECAMPCEVQGIDKKIVPGHSYCWWVRSGGLTCMEVSLYGPGFLIRTHRHHPEYVRLAQVFSQVTGIPASVDTFLATTVGGKGTS